MLEKLMYNPYAWGILSFIAIISFIYAIYCQKKNKEKKEISFAKNSDSLILKKKSKFEKLYILYDDQQIDNLCVSKYVIWNSGNKTLNSLDIVSTKEITIKTFNNNTILDSEIIACSESTNNFRIEKISENIIKVIFDYIEPKDGVVIQIMHTGTKEDIKILCKIKGGNDLKPFMTTDTYSVRTRNSKKFSAAYILFTIIALTSVWLFSIISSILIENNIITDKEFISRIISNESLHISPFWLVIFTLFIVFALYLSIKIFKSEFMVGIPQKLKKYFAKEIE